MRSIRFLLKNLRNDFPQFSFEFADEFWWSATKKTIYINKKASYGSAYTLHELSHALLGHSGYKYDIDLIKIERDAWEHARNSLSPLYDIRIDDEIVQDNLDTYREWLYARSTCPDCNTIGVEIKTQQYRCLACNHKWRVNEARLCALRRYSMQTK